jgi:putative addiction module component (TIGR02574 family)
MADIVTELEDRARRLSAKDRARLALSLIESLEPDDGDDVEEAWRIEIEARAVALDRGEATTVPAAEVFAEIRRKLK